MGWSEWPYWLRGGIVFGILSLIITAFYQTGDLFGKGLFGIYSLPALIILAIFAGLGLVSKGCSIRYAGYSNMPPCPNYIYVIFLFFVNLLIFFFIGAIIGWLYGKIKGR